MIHLRLVIGHRRRHLQITLRYLLQAELKIACRSFDEQCLIFCTKISILTKKKIFGKFWTLFPSTLEMYQDSEFRKQMEEGSVLDISAASRTSSRIYFQATVKTALRAHSRYRYK